MRTTRSLLSAVALLLLAPAAPAQQPPPRAVTTLQDVRTIYLGRFGDSDEAERFRMILSIELPRRGFTLVHVYNDADVKLQGIMTIHDSFYGPVVNCTAELVNQRNDRIWARDFGPKYGLGRSAIFWPHPKDGVKDIAENLAKELKKARQSAAPPALKSR